ncbi:29720_t:CDS:1, partial [Racocetra persica]
LLEQCLNFYNDHHINKLDLKANIYSALVNAYSTKMPSKSLETYKQLESLQCQLYQEGTQEYARNIGLGSLNLGIALSKSSLAFLANFDIADKMLEEKISSAREINIKARDAVNKTIHLFAKFYPKEDYLYSQACNALTNIEFIKNELAMLPKLLESNKFLNDGNLDKAKSIYCEVFDLSLNQELKSGALSSMITIDFIKIKKNGIISHQIRNNLFEQYKKVTEIYDSSDVQITLAMICFIEDYHEKAIIYAENSIQRLPVSSNAKVLFKKVESPILPTVLQMALMDKDEIKNIPIEFLARYIIINSMNSLGHIHSEMQALKEFALLLSPNDAAICYLLLGFCYLRQGDWISALQAFDFVNQKEPDFK